MKKLIAILSFVILSLVFTINVNAQGGTNPPPPPGGGSGGAGAGDHEIGGGAPIGGGLFILLGLGAAYGSRKLYHLQEEDAE